jgi:hypothetical protein
MIEDWFTNSGQTFDVEEYDRWDKAYDNWVRESSIREMNYQLGDCREGECTCEPIPENLEKSDYFSAERTPRLLSEVLANWLRNTNGDGRIRSSFAQLHIPLTDHTDFTKLHSYQSCCSYLLSREVLFSTPANRVFILLVLVRISADGWKL